MTLIRRHALPLLIAAACAGSAGPALAQSDNMVYEQALERSASICPGFAPERARPGIRAVPVGALRVLAKRSFTLCPDRRLEPTAPVVWYGQSGVFTWLPDSDAAIAVLKARVDAMTRSEDFPVETQAWDADGKALSGKVLPTFELRPAPWR